MSKGNKEKQKKVYNWSRHILPEVVAGGREKKRPMHADPVFSDY